MKHAGVRGFSMSAVSINLLLVGALLVMAPLVVPSYVEYLTIEDLITPEADKYEHSSESVTDLRFRLARVLNTDQIDDTSIDDVEVYRERGAIVVAANYERRFPVSGYWTES